MSGERLRDVFFFSGSDSDTETEILKSFFKTINFKMIFFKHWRKNNDLHKTQLAHKNDLHW